MVLNNARKALGTDQDAKTFRTPGGKVVTVRTIGEETAAESEREYEKGYREFGFNPERFDYDPDQFDPDCFDPDTGEYEG